MKTICGKKVNDFCERPGSSSCRKINTNKHHNYSDTDMLLIEIWVHVFKHQLILATLSIRWDTQRNSVTALWVRSSPLLNVTHVQSVWAEPRCSHCNLTFICNSNLQTCCSRCGFSIRTDRIHSKGHQKKKKINQHETELDPKAQQFVSFMRTTHIVHQ